MKVLVTGAAGFIGSSLCRQLLNRGDSVVGIDNLNTYYDVSLKEARLNQLTTNSDFKFYKADISEGASVQEIFAKESPVGVVNLAAQAGVRYSLKNPKAYTDANIQGFLSILEACRHTKVEHLVFASSSSVYGMNKKVPFSVDDNVDHPVSLYGATKKANELMAHSYSHLYGLPTTGLRFFTVYGPWGRPDMSMFLFTKAILSGDSIEVFNFGEHRRDFTYIDDIVEGVMRVLDRPPVYDSNINVTPGNSTAPYRVYNIGGSQPVWLMDMIACLEEALGKKAILKKVPMQPGDVLETFADVDSLERDTGFRPKTDLKTGVRHFVKWYREFYG